MITLRKATEDDQRTIRRMVLSALLNPRDLRWQNFLIADDDETRQIVAIGQVRVHIVDESVGTQHAVSAVNESASMPSPNDAATSVIKELASIVVVPQYRGQGIGAAIIAALEQRAGRPLYLMCAPHNVAYYQRLGYVETDDAAAAAAILPPRIVVWLIKRVLRSRIHLMKKAAMPSSN